MSITTKEDALTFIASVEDVKKRFGFEILFENTTKYC